ncbi:hypothetical protein ABZP36_033714 [Zizania latifolia]
MSTSPWPPAVGAAPDPAPAAPPEGAVADGATAPAAESAAPTSEQHPVKEGGDAAATAAVQQQQEEEEETKPQLLCEDDSEADQEHEQKINKYQAILAARLKDKYFSNKAFDGGDVFEAEIIVDGEIIQSSMYVSSVLLTIHINFQYRNYLHFFFIGGHVQVHLQTQ